MPLPNGGAGQRQTTYPRYRCLDLFWSGRQPFFSPRGTSPRAWPNSTWSSPSA